MIRVDNIVKPHDWNELYNIHFKFTEKNGRKGSGYFLCENLSTIDDETSAGINIDGKAIPFEKEKYDAEFDLPRNLRVYQILISTGVPVSCTVCWQWAIESILPPPHNISVVYVFMGRTAEDLKTFSEMVRKEIKRQAIFGFTCSNRNRETMLAQKNKKNVHFKIYDHHLGYELGTLFSNIWHKEFTKKGHVFAREACNPMKVDVLLDRVKMIFCDTVILTQKSLFKWTHDEKLPVMKLEEDQDFYEVMRNPLTELDDEFVRYAINDVYSMIFAMDKYRDKYGSTHNIPLTQTACVRIAALEDVWHKDPQWCMECCNIEQNYTLELYQRLIAIFSGGYTHGSNMFTGSCLGDKEIEEYFELVKQGKYDEAYNIPGLVHHYDFCSSYPSVATRFKLPVSDFVKGQPGEFRLAKDTDPETSDIRWFALLEFTHVESKLVHTFWSNSKCVEVDNAMLDNGRIESADRLLVWMTDFDWDTFKHAYDFDPDIICYEFWSAEAGYISKALIEHILDLFHKKNAWKGLEEYESQLTFVKQQLNAISYGCAVFKEIGAEVSYTDDGWEVDREQSVLTFQDKMEKKKPEKTFWAFQHGCWIVNIAKWCLWSFITGRYGISMDSHSIYEDTDSLFILQNDEDVKTIKAYNDHVKEMQDKVAAELGFDPNEFLGVNAKGKAKRLGLLEEEDPVAIRQWGAKKYCTRSVHYNKETGDPEEIRIGVTVSGLPKKAGTEKIKSLQDFDIDLLWRTGESHKLTPHYNFGTQPETIWTDYQGHTYVNHDTFGIALLPTTFSMGISQDFYAFIEFLICGKISDYTFFYDTPKILLQMDCDMSSPTKC